MRITGGTLVNTIIDCPKKDIRPAMDRMRESLFAMLGDLNGQSFLDLFSGSGICGIEAFSRGACPVVLVEKDRKKIPIIKKNIAPYTPHILCKCIPTEAFLQNSKKEFTIIYCDPPFPYQFRIELIQIASRRPILKPNGLFLLHRPKEDTPPKHIENLFLIDRRQYGRSIVDWYKKEM